MVLLSRLSLCIAHSHYVSCALSFYPYCHFWHFVPCLLCFMCCLIILVAANPYFNRWNRSYVSIIWRWIPEKTNKADASLLLCCHMNFSFLLLGFHVQWSWYIVPTEIVLWEINRIKWFTLICAFQIFAPYGRVEDVYLMRDDMRQSRGILPSIRVWSILLYPLLSYRLFSNLPFWRRKKTCFCPPQVCFVAS